MINSQTQDLLHTICNVRPLTPTVKNNSDLDGFVSKTCLVDEGRFLLFRWKNKVTDHVSENILYSCFNMLLRYFTYKHNFVN